MFIIFVSKLAHAQYNSSKLETGSLIQFGNPVQYGVIKRIETTVAEVETVSYTYMDTVLITHATNVYRCSYVCTANCLC